MGRRLLPLNRPQPPFRRSKPRIPKVRTGTYRISRSHGSEPHCKPHRCAFRVRTFSSTELLDRIANTPSRLHIEQGPILESTESSIGAVEGVQAYRWHTITIKGADCHTGTTSFPHRADALLTAAKCILHSHNVAASLNCLASTGILTLAPGSTNTVPGEVVFSLDIRSTSDDVLKELEAKLKEGFESIARGEEVGGLNAQGMGVRGRACEVTWRLDADSPATKFHDDCIRCVEASARDLIGAQAERKMRRMTSGAGHDR